MRVMLVYTSLTGNTRTGAEIVTETLEELDAEVDVFQGYAADPFDYADYDICVVGTYTYGIQGELPDEIVDFFEELEEVNLEGKIYGVFGSGDVFYGDNYCVSVDDFEAQFENTQAKQGAAGVKYNLDPQKEDVENLQTFAKKLVKKYKALE